MKRYTLLAMAALAMATPLTAQQPQSSASAPAKQTPIEARADQVVALLNGTAAPEDVFSKSFQAAIPAAQIKALSANFTAQYGPAIEVALLAPRDGTQAALEIRFERGLAKGSLAIDPAEENRISELLFTSLDALVVADDTPEKIAADLATLPGTVNAWFGPLDGSEPAISIAPETPLALGSTFKLYVLAALAEDVNMGRRKWSDVVPLTEKSYPSGKLQDWPKGSPVTLHTLASLMISISDNTATDQLIEELGRERILTLMRDSGHADPTANDPFLKTRELFVIKAGAPDQIAAYRSGDKQARAAVLTSVGSQTATVEQVSAAFGGGPKALEVEWFASPADLAKLLTYLRRTADPKAFDIMAINPSAGPLIAAGWDYIGYKGGSEPGVMNLTWLLRDKAGRDHVLTLGWNNPAASLDEGKLQAIAQRILLLPR